jgi:mutator protein MutT
METSPESHAVDVGIGIVVDPSTGAPTPPRLLVCQRRADDYWGGWWEFPGGKREPPESIADCVVRELREELGIDVSIASTLPTIEHLYTDRNRLVRLHPHVCRLRRSPDRAAAAAPAALEVACFRWCTIAEIADLKFLPANGPIIAALAEHLLHHT